MADQLTKAYQQLHVKRLMADLGGAKNIQRVRASDSQLTVVIRVENLVMPAGQFLYDGFLDMRQGHKRVQVQVTGSAAKMRWQLWWSKVRGQDGFDEYNTIPDHPQAQAAALIFESFGPQYNLKNISCPDDQHLTVQIVDASLVASDQLFKQLKVGITQIDRTNTEITLTIPHANAVRMLIYFYQ